MIELVYVSRAEKRFTSAELVDMLRLFRKNNQAAGITGLFLYDGFGTFIQALEGTNQVVQSLFEKIRRDDRHSRVNLLGETNIENRSFPEWRMGFKNLDQFQLSNLEGYSDFLQQTERQSYLTQQPSFAMELLQYFKNNSNLDLDKD